MIQAATGQVGLGKHRETGLGQHGDDVWALPALADAQHQRSAQIGRLLVDGEEAGRGQGDLQATPLQLAVAYATIANGGSVVRPHVAQEVEVGDDVTLHLYSADQLDSFDEGNPAGPTIDATIEPASNDNCLPSGRLTVTLLMSLALHR